MQTKLYIKIVALLLVIATLFSLVACDTSGDPPSSDKPSWLNPSLSDPNEIIIEEGTLTEDMLIEDMLTEDIEVEAILYEQYIEELVDVEKTVTELLLAEDNISEVLYHQVLYVPQEHLYDFAENSQTTQMFGDDIDFKTIIPKVATGAGIIVALTVCSAIGFSKPIVTATFTAAAKGSAIGAGIGAAVGGTLGGATGALNEIDSTGRNSAAFGLAVAIAGLVISTVSLVSSIPSGGLTGIGAIQGAKLVMAGLGLVLSAVDTTVSAVDCVKTFKATEATDIDWENVNWNDVGLTAAEQAINGAANGVLAGAVTGAITGGVYGYLDYKLPTSVYSAGKKIGTINELGEYVDGKTGKVVGKVVRSEDVDGNPIFYVKENIDPKSVKVIGDIPENGLSKLNKKSVYGQLDKNGNVNANWLKDFEAARNRGVRLAWEQEKALVERTGRGTRDWTSDEIVELLTTGKVKGYEGHHINSALFSPELADNPNNIIFYSTSEHLKIGHGGNYQNVTFGELLYRN